MLINVGGGDPGSGPVAGIHWHMNLGNQIIFIVTEYNDRSRRLSAEQIASAEKRRMDCIDCHNRPAHTYLPPNVALDQSFAAGRLDPALPYLKRQAVEVLNKPYATEGEALNAIASGLNGFYCTSYSQLYVQKPTPLKPRSVKRSASSRPTSSPR